MGLFSRIFGARQLSNAQGVPGSGLGAIFAPGLGYEGSRFTRRLRTWLPERASINALQAQGGDVVRARVRQLARDNPLAASAIDTWVGSVVGDGITPSPILDDGALKTALKNAWLRWTDECDVDGLTDFYGMEALVARAVFVSGECFIRFRPRRVTDGLSVPLQLQMIEAEQLPLSYNVEKAKNGNDIRHGIEFDALGRRVAYHFLKVRPGDGRGVYGTEGVERSRVPANDVLHIFQPLEAGQIRGQSKLQASMVRLHLLDSYDDAEMDRKRTAAMFAGFITKNAIGDPLPVIPGHHPEGIGAFGAYADPTTALPMQQGADLEQTVADLEPGTMQVLNPGEKIEFSEPADVGGSYEAFQYRQQLAISAGLGVPYAAMSNDASKGNFSSQRAVELEYKRRVSQVQHQVIVFAMCRPVWTRWLEVAAVAGSISELTASLYVRERSKLGTVKWQPPKWDWVDPLKDLKADELELNLGLSSRSAKIEARGDDPDEVDRQRREDQERAEGIRPIGESPNDSALSDERPPSSGAVEDQ